LGEAIGSGRYRPGEKLPPHREVADDFGVSVGTIKRAFALLQSQGLIVTRQGQGAFVRTQPIEPGAEDGLGPSCGSAPRLIQMSESTPFRRIAADLNRTAA
jgi:DNA-binding FadR family transcriptional regulator